jgi:predicted RNase H-like nuclease (RuvC/YqgF family)
MRGCLRVHAPHTSMKLAERQVLLSNGLQVREVRKLSEGGHQTAIIGTDYRSEIIAVAAQMFSRWSQENFFRYMREHFNLDRLVDYKTSALDETIQVVNPRWRSLDAQVRSKVSILNRKNAQYGAMQLEGEIDPERVERYQHDKAQLLQQIVPLKAEIEQLKKERKDTAHHIRVADLPADQRFNQLSTKTRDLVDTIKMIAYRAETAMAYIVREKMTRPDDARTLLRQVYETETDLLPNYQDRTLTVRLHHMANRAHDAVVSHLCDKLNETATTFPGTDLRLIYKIGSE